MPQRSLAAREASSDGQVDDHQYGVDQFGGCRHQPVLLQRLRTPRTHRPITPRGRSVAGVSTPETCHEVAEELSDCSMNISKASWPISKTGSLPRIPVWTAPYAA